MTDTAAVNPDLELAFKIIEETGTSLFLTGKAGTGKTTFLRRLRGLTSKRNVVAAPTGIAAINAGGVTLHSLFQIPPGIHAGNAQSNKFKMSKSKLTLIRSIDLLIIDEISMVRADLLDIVDRELRRIRRNARPFGGVQLLMIGDLQQLPPVMTDDETPYIMQRYASPYFFEAEALKRLPYAMVELKKVYRQSDTEFVDLLNHIREGNPSREVMEKLNCRYSPGFKPETGVNYVRLTTHNDRARKINGAAMEGLKGRSMSYQATVQGKFPEVSYPAEEELTLKEGAQVMFIRNDPSGENQYYNGLIGKVTELTQTLITVTTPEGRAIKVKPVNWDNNKFTIDEATGNVKTEKEGSFSQFPLRAAWAITIHKSQGLTFDHAIIDASRSFAHGQAYVALSRCRTLEGLVLECPLTEGAVICDSTVTLFMQAMARTAPGAEDMAAMQRDFGAVCIDEMFDPAPLSKALDALFMTVSEAFCKSNTKLTERYRKYMAGPLNELRNVFGPFARQYRALGAAADTRDALNARLKAGAAYYSEHYRPLQTLLSATPRRCDNKETTKRLKERSDELHELLHKTLNLLEWQQSSDFTVAEFMKRRKQAMAHTALQSEKRTKSPDSALGPDYAALRRDKLGQRREKAVAQRERETAAMAAGENAAVYCGLAEWRTRKSYSEGKPAFVFGSDRLLHNLATVMPRNMEELKTVKGAGATYCKLYGAEWLRIVADNI